jgi:hypothetical protein
LDATPALGFVVKSRGHLFNWLFAMQRHVVVLPADKSFAHIRCAQVNDPLLVAGQFKNATPILRQLSPLNHQTAAI